MPKVQRPRHRLHRDEAHVPSVKEALYLKHCTFSVELNAKELELADFKLLPVKETPEDLILWYDAHSQTYRITHIKKKNGKAGITRYYALGGTKNYKGIARYKKQEVAVATQLLETVDAAIKRREPLDQATLDSLQAWMSETHTAMLGAPPPLENDEQKS